MQDIYMYVYIYIARYICVQEVLPANWITVLGNMEY